MRGGVGEGEILIFYNSLPPLSSSQLCSVKGEGGRDVTIRCDDELVHLHTSLMHDYIDIRHCEKDKSNTAQS